MPARSIASLPCAERGAAIILAMLTVALVAALAAAVIGDYGASVESVSGRHDQAQARLLARAAVNWARNVLADDARTSSPQIDYYGEAWATRVPPTPVEEGEVGGELTDLSGRFNLNSLVVNGVADKEQLDAYGRLLAALGVSKAQADALAAALVDWIDPDGSVTSSGGAESEWYAQQTPPRLPANAPLVEVDELGLVRGYDANLMAQLRPYVAALPENNTPLNVNTASAEVLAAVVPGLGIDAARVVAAEQLSAPFRDVADFVARLPRTGLSPNVSRLAVKSRYFLASGRAHFGEATTRMEVMLDRQNVWPEIIWQKIL